MKIKDTNPTADTPTHRPGEALGDLGGEKTWASPQGEQGISNRPDDEGEDEPGDRPSQRD